MKMKNITPPKELIDRQTVMDTIQSWYNADMVDAAYHRELLHRVYLIPTECRPEECREDDGK
jgi:hypothetical protein